MRKKIFLGAVIAAISAQFLLAGDKLLVRNSCTKWNLGIVTFYTGSATYDVYDDEGEYIGQVTEKCGETTWFWE